MTGVAKSLVSLLAIVSAPLLVVRAEDVLDHKSPYSIVSPFEGDSWQRHDGASLDKERISS